MKERKSQKWLQLLKGDFLPDHNLLATEEIKNKRKKNPIKRQSLYLRSGDSEKLRKSLVAFLISYALLKLQ